jgi:AAA15 family ATPase/GTPase
VFIGAPNVGKSNILEALALQSGRHNKLTQVRLCDVVRVKQMSELFNEDNVSTPIEVKLDEDSYTLTFVSKEEVLVSNLQHRDSNTHQVELRVMKSDGILPVLFNTISQDEFAINKYEFKKSAPFFSDNILQLKAPFGNNLVDLINLNSELRAFVVSEFERYNLKVVVDAVDNLIYFIKEKNSGIFSKIYYHQVADTLQRLIFYKAAILSNKKNVLLFEEPEAHMFPPYVSRFTRDIMDDENGNQYFINTHSPFVLNDFMEHLDLSELGIYVVGYANGATVIVRLTDEQVKQAYQYGIDLFFNLENYFKHED